MKPFLVFAFSTHYPSGGWSDFRGDFESYGAALEFIANLDDIDQWQIVGALTKSVLGEGVRR